MKPPKNEDGIVKNEEKSDCGKYTWLLGPRKINFRPLFSRQKLNGTETIRLGEKQARYNFQSSFETYFFSPSLLVNFSYGNNIKPTRVL